MVRQVCSMKLFVLSSLRPTVLQHSSSMRLTESRAEEKQNDQNTDWDMIEVRQQTLNAIPSYRWHVKASRARSVEQIPARASLVGQ